jgi:hypothetical protein
MTAQVKLDDWGTNDTLPAQLGLTPAEYVLVKNASTDAALREKMVGELTRLFIRLNTALFAGIAAIFILDAGLLYCRLISPSERVVSEKVVMTLIAATAVQLGIGVAAMVAYLFPKRTASEPGAGTPAPAQAPSQEVSAGDR